MARQEQQQQVPMKSAAPRPKPVASTHAAPLNSAPRAIVSREVHDHGGRTQAQVVAQAQWKREHPDPTPKPAVQSSPSRYASSLDTGHLLKPLSGVSVSSTPKLKGFASPGVIGSNSREESLASLSAHSSPFFQHEEFQSLSSPRNLAVDSSIQQYQQKPRQQQYAMNWLGDTQKKTYATNFGAEGLGNNPSALLGEGGQFQQPFAGSSGEWCYYIYIISLP